MVRLAIPVGSYGEINYQKPKQGRAGAVQARAQFRGYDGKLRPVARRGRNRTEARTALLAAIEDLKLLGSNDLTPASKINDVAARYFEEIDRRLRDGTIGHSTARHYRNRWDNHLAPAVGELRCQEMTVSACQRTFDAYADSGMSGELRKALRTVLQEVLKFAVRHDALADNPATKISPILTPKAERRETVVPTDDEIAAWFTFLAADKWSIRLELPELCSMLLATGVRISEMLAVHTDEIDPAAKIIPVTHHIVRIPGDGLHRVAGLKAGGVRDLHLPTWATTIVQRRMALHPSGALFPPPMGRPGSVYRDPHQLARNFGAALERATEGDESMAALRVRPHDFRRIVLTELVDGGVPMKAAADHAGHSTTRTTERYLGRGLVGEKSLAVLETLNPYAAEARPARTTANRRRSSVNAFPSSRARKSLTKA